MRLITRPFLKWAGGKRWLLDRAEFQLPQFSGRYIEPFLGGAAVFFHLSPKKAILSDVNNRLIETYVVIRDNLSDLMPLLRAHDRAHSSEYYYRIRGEVYGTPPERAAQFIYLNRACWNGLYRVNKAGEFNVPVGTKDWILSAGDQFPEIAGLLASADIRASDFEATIDQAGEGDLVFIDPPYTTAHNFNGFVKYNSTIFQWDDQTRLNRCIRSATRRGATVVMTNADHESIHELYSDMGFPKIVRRHSVISGASSSRRQTTEALFVFQA